MPLASAVNVSAVHPTPPPPPPTPQPPHNIQRPVLLVEKYVNASISRYSVAKFKELFAYSDNVSSLRVALVLLLTPLPGLVVSVLPAPLPLQAPQLGYNVAFFFHAAIVDFSCGLGIIGIWCSVGKSRNPSTRAMRPSPSAWSTALHVLLLYLTARFWRFPVPFAWILFAWIFLDTLIVAHVIGLRRKLWRSAVLHRALRAYSASMLFQSCQILFYPAFSVLFDNVSNSWRVVLTLVFPLMKHATKHTVQRLSRHLRDHNAEIVVCGVEICVALYQSMILQSSPASIGIPFIIRLDVLQAMIMVKLLFDRHAEFSRPDDLLMDTASVLIRRFNVKSESEIKSVHSLNRLTRYLSAQTTPASGTSMPVIVTTNSRSKNTFVLRDARSPHQHSQNLLVQNALEMAFAAEQVVLIEYIEVFVPLLNSLFLLLTARRPSARFNPRLLPFYTNDGTYLWNSVGTIWLYSLLQAA